MQRMLAIFSSLTVVVGAIGCSSSSSSSSAPGCAPAEASFANDVMPIFQTNCAQTNACHGQLNDSTADLYLGPNTGKPDGTAVYPMIFDVKAKENPSMNIVTPGSTADSFLWHKLQTMGDLQTLAGQCSKAPTMCIDCNAGSPCGAVMPYFANALSVTLPDAVCTIQNWIQNGAKNN